MPLSYNSISGGGTSIPKGTTAARPANPSIGDFYYNGTIGAQEIYTSSGWVTLGAIPSSPTGASAVDVGTSRAYNNGAGTVSFSAPSGGGFITGYTVVSSPGGYTAVGSSSPIIVNGLQSNTAYTFTVTATNSYGNSLASAPTSSITATTIPDVPTSVVASKVSNISYGSNPQMSVAFTPNANGGKTATYTVTSSPGNLTATGSASPLTVTGLTAGTSYTFTVKSNNANGTTADSTASAAVIAATVPQSPTIGTATDVGTSRPFNNGAATVAFTAPSNNGGSAITSYTVTSTPGNFTATGASSPITVTGLQSNTSYTFKVKATNAVGDSLESSSSNSITATTIPEAPTIGTAADTFNGKISVSFTAGATGGKSVTYTATSSPSAITGTSSSTPITVSGLTIGTPYTFTVTASNANGTSAASAASNAATSTSQYELSSTFTSSGTFTVPSGMTKLAIVSVGAGESGVGGGYGTTAGGAGGKAGGGFGFKEVTVTPGTQYTVTVGSTTSFGNLGTTSYNSTTSNVAGAVIRNSVAGGNGGTGGYDSAGGNGGAGGTPGTNIDLSVSNIPVYAMPGSGGGGGGGAYAGWNAQTYRPPGNGGAAGSPGGGSGGNGAGAAAYIDPYNGWYGSGSPGSSGGSANTSGAGGGGGGGSGNNNDSAYLRGSGGNGGTGLVRVYVKPS